MLGVHSPICLPRVNLAVGTWTPLEFGHKIGQVSFNIGLARDQNWRYILMVYIVEWQIVDIALQGCGKVGVSLYDTLGKDSVGKQNIFFVV